MARTWIPVIVGRKSACWKTSVNEMIGCVDYNMALEGMRETGL